MSAFGDGSSTSKKNPRRARRGCGSRRYRLGDGRRLLRGGGPRLGDAGDEAVGQPGSTLEGAAGVGADALEGGEGNHEGKDAPSWIAGSDGDGWRCDVVVVFVALFQSSLPFTARLCMGAGRGAL